METAKKLKDKKEFTVDIELTEDLSTEETASDTDEDDGGFTVDNDKKASWCLRKIRQLKKKQNDNDKLAQEMIDKLKEEIKEIENWRDEENNKLQNNIEFMENKLYDYALRLREEDPELKTINLPFGKLKFRKQRPKWKYDDDKLLEFLENNYPKLVRVKKNPDKRKLKKKANVTNDKAVLPDTGEIVEGVQITDRPEKFKVEINQ